MMQKRKEAGVTLIALVVTIIVLLILAGVSISMLTGDNGILTQAKLAKKETEEKGALEAIQIEIMGSFSGKGTYDSSLAKTNLENKLQAEVEQKANGELHVKYKGYEFDVDAEGNVKIDSNTDLNTEISKLKIGDNVDYQPTIVTSSYDKVGTTYTGGSNTAMGQTTNLTWRILSINENSVELISNERTSKSLEFTNAIGFNNGVSILNDYCNKMYSNETNGAVARSLNIEDIQEKMKIGSDGKKAYEKYKTSNTEKTYNSEPMQYQVNRYYPLKWKNDNGIANESNPQKPESSDIVEYSIETDAYTEHTSSNTLDVIQTCWNLSSTSMTGNFNTADTRDSTKANTIYQELLCSTSSGGFYWLASRGVDTSDSESAKFCLRAIEYGDIINVEMFRSNRMSLSTSNKYYVRPVVELPIDAIDLNTDYDSIGKWNLK